MVDLTALLDGLFLHAALVVVLVVDTVADDGAGNRASRCCGRAAIAATDLAAEQGAGDTADDGAASAALLRRRLHLHVFRTAFLAWTIDLFHLRHDAHDLAEIFKVGSLSEWQCADTEG